MGPIKLTIILVAVLSAVIAAFLRSRRWRAATPYLVRTDARVADVSTSDVGSGRNTETVHRVVFVFTLPSGEQHAVDLTEPLSDWQKDLLLPDRMVPIEYDSRDPDRFRVRFDELKQRG